MVKDRGRILMGAGSADQIIFKPAFHGTIYRRGKNIIKTGIFYPSQGHATKQHWLGDGVYFFREYRDVKEWVRRYDTYIILEASIVVERDNLLDLDQEEDYALFEKIATRILEEKINNNIAEIIIDKKNKIDGYVINFMCTALALPVDVVKATFSFRSNLSSYTDIFGTNPTRIPRKVQVQYCVRNTDCISRVSIKEEEP